MNSPRTGGNHKPPQNIIDAWHVKSYGCDSRGIFNRPDLIQYNPASLQRLPFRGKGREPGHDQIRVKEKSAIRLGAKKLPGKHRLTRPVRPRNNHDMFFQTYNSATNTAAF